MVKGIAWAGKVPSPKLGGVSMGIIRVKGGRNGIDGYLLDKSDL